jgi:hypothetical protein
MKHFYFLPSSLERGFPVICSTSHQIMKQQSPRKVSSGIVLCPLESLSSGLPQFVHHVDRQWRVLCSCREMLSVNISTERGKKRE